MSRSDAGGAKLPGVSVIIPVYNRPDLAMEALRSVLFQTHTELECLLLDDGSEQPPDEAVRIFSRDPRFRYIRIEHTGMPGAVRNRGVEAARFSLIAFLDSDDIWYPQKLERQVDLYMQATATASALAPAGPNPGVPEDAGPGADGHERAVLQPERSNTEANPAAQGGPVPHSLTTQAEASAAADEDAGPRPEPAHAELSTAAQGFQREAPPALIHSRETWLRGSKIISQKSQKQRRRGDVFEDALEKCMIGPSTVLMQRSVFDALGGFREDLEIAEDYEFWLRLTARYPVEYIEEPLVLKRAGHGEQLSEKYGQIEIFRIRGLEDFVKKRGRLPKSETGIPAADALAPERHRKAVRELERKCRIYAAGCRKRGREEEAARYEEAAAELRSELEAGVHGPD